MTTWSDKALRATRREYAKAMRKHRRPRAYRAIDAERWLIERQRKQRLKEGAK